MKLYWQYNFPIFFLKSNSFYINSPIPLQFHSVPNHKYSSDAAIALEEKCLLPVQCLQALSLGGKAGGEMVTKESGDKEGRGRCG